MKNIYNNKIIGIITLGLLLASVVSLAFLLQSCNNEFDIPEQKVYKSELLLNLIAPSGEKIADNIHQLKDIVSPFVTEKFGIDKEFYFTNLDYMPLEKGYLVLIKYQTVDNIIGGIVRTNNPASLTIDPKLTVKIRNKVRLKGDGENSAVFDGVTYTCTNLDTCKCIPTFSSRPGGGYTFTCGCSQCSGSAEF